MGKGQGAMANELCLTSGPVHCLMGHLREHLSSFKVEDSFLDWFLGQSPSTTSFSGFIVPIVFWKVSHLPPPDDLFTLEENSWILQGRVPFKMMYLGSFPLICLDQGKT